MGKKHIFIKTHILGTFRHLVAIKRQDISLHALIESFDVLMHQQVSLLLTNARLTISRGTKLKKSKPVR